MGIFSRSLCLDEGLDKGSMLPYVRRFELFLFFLYEIYVAFHTHTHTHTPFSHDARVHHWQVRAALAEGFADMILRPNANSIVSGSGEKTYIRSVLFCYDMIWYHIMLDDMPVNLSLTSSFAKVEYYIQFVQILNTVYFLLLSPLPLPLISFRFHVLSTSEAVRPPKLTCCFAGRT